jgi:hypothetical protein
MVVVIPHIVEVLKKKKQRTLGVKLNIIGLRINIRKDLIISIYCCTIDLNMKRYSKKMLKCSKWKRGKKINYLYLPSSII